MGKRFVSKKRKKSKVKYLVYILVVYLLFHFVMGFVSNAKLASSNEEFLRYLMQDGNHYLDYDSGSKLSYEISKLLSHFDLKNPITIIEKMFGIKKKEKTASDGEEQVPTKMTFHINDPNPTVVKKPRVYVYNTHQLENYDMENLAAHNITPNVMMASYLLKENLNKIGIETIAEEGDISKYLKEHNLKYADSYKASRTFLEQKLNEYKQFDLIIDLHRDALSKKNSTVVIEQKSYAKVMFVVGLEHKNYQANLDLANRMDQLLKERYPTLSRGVMTKEGKNVNGIYNQDLSPNIVLIECGGNENTIEEVQNTIGLLTEVIKALLGG